MLAWDRRRVVDVWLDAWQMQCCGEPFRIGDETTFGVHAEPDVEWLETVLGPAAARRVTYSGEWHTEPDERDTDLTGRVASIAAAHCRYAADPDNSRSLHPVPGSGVLKEVERADGWETEDLEAGWIFVGYVVDLQNAPAEG